MSDRTTEIEEFRGILLRTRKEVEELKSALLAIQKEIELLRSENHAQQRGVEDPYELYRNLSEDSRNILSQLEQKPRLTMQQIRLGLGSKKSLGRVSDLLATLEGNGFVIRYRGNDGFYKWEILEKGKRALSAIELVQQETGSRRTTVR